MYIVPLLFGYDATLDPDLVARFVLPFSPPLAAASASPPGDLPSDTSVLFKVGGWVSYLAGWLVSAMW